MWFYMIIDTHIHLNDPSYDNILDDIIQTSFQHQVKKMFIVGYDKKSSERAIEIANQYPNLFAIVGLHPSEVNKEEDIELTWLLKMLQESKVIGIGEIGLDFHWDKDNKELQEEYFVKQIEIANQYHKPVSIHSRDACELTYQILKEHPTKGIIHCYSYSLEMAYQFIQEGYYLGIGGVLTFKNTKLKKIVEKIDLTHLVTETDAPYLTPVPFRGTLNKPEYISYVIQEISNLKGIPTQIIEDQVEKNVKKIYGV